MDIWELIETLTKMANDMEARNVDRPKLVVAQQPSYPLEGSLRGAVCDGDKIVLVSGDASEYSDSAYWDEV